MRTYTILLGLPKKVIPFLLIFCLFAGLVCSEEIELNSGARVAGKVIERGRDYIKVDIGGVILTYYEDEIRAIDGQDPGFSGVSEVKPEEMDYAGGGNLLP